MHQNAGKSIGQCLSARLDYVTDEEKTRKRNEDEEEEKSKYITSYACNAAIAKEEFMNSRNEYIGITGRQATLSTGTLIVFIFRYPLFA